MTSDQIILEKFITNHPADAARMLERLNSTEIIDFIAELPVSLVVLLFRHLGREKAAQCLEKLGYAKSAAIIEKLDALVASIFLRRVTEEARREILNAVSEKLSHPLRRLLNYPEDSAGALADPSIIIVTEDLIVKEVLQRMRKSPDRAIYYLYIVNRDQVLTGVMNMQELMLARPKEQLSAVMHAPVVRLSAGLSYQEILKHPGWQDFYALPVVEDKGLLLGAVRYKILKRIEKEAGKSRLPHEAISTGVALGDLFQLGFSGLIRSATTSLKGRVEDK